jgi:predicted porin
MDSGSLAAPGNLLFGRNAYVGISGEGGALIAGRFFTPYYQALSFVDPFSTGLAGAASNLMATTGLRMSNAIRYTTMLHSLWNFEMAWGLGEVAGDARASNAFGATLGYTGHVWSVRLSRHSRNSDTATLHNQGRAVNSLLAATADFRSIKFHLAYAWNAGKGSAGQAFANPYGDAAPPPDTPQSRDMLAGLTVPVHAGKIMFSLIRKDDRTSSNADARQLALGYVHTLSKTTDLYAAYGQLTHQRGARYTVGNQSGDPGSGDHALNLGMRHSF